MIFLILSNSALDIGYTLSLFLDISCRGFVPTGFSLCARPNGAYRSYIYAGVNLAARLIQTTLLSLV